MKYRKIDSSLLAVGASANWEIDTCSRTTKIYFIINSRIPPLAGAIGEPSMNPAGSHARGDCKVWGRVDDLPPKEFVGVAGKFGGIWRFVASDVTRPSSSMIGWRRAYRRTPPPHRQTPQSHPPPPHQRWHYRYAYYGVKLFTLPQHHAYLVGALAVDGHDESHAARFFLQLRVVQTVFLRTGPRVLSRHRLFLVLGHFWVLVASVGSGTQRFVFYLLW